MIAEQYRKQVELLLKVLPTVAEQECFALHGGTAINLFMLDLPRLSVDIDLTYLPIQTRRETLAGITDALKAIQSKLNKLHPSIRITTKEQEGSDVKLLCSEGRSNIKIEVNTIKRGTLQPSQLLPISDNVQDEFSMFAAMHIVPEDELWGGKICAALDRQHPRDLFDMANYFASGKQLSDDRSGFLLALLGHNRPFHEVLSPSQHDQRHAYDQQFAGMTNQPFTYEDYETTRAQLCATILTALTKEDKAFLMSFASGKPDWHGYEAYKQFPSIQWKLQNIQKIAQNNSLKYEEQLHMLDAVLFRS